MTLKQPPSPACPACTVPGQPAVRHAMGAPCPKAPAQPRREEIAAKRRADEDAAAAERRRTFYEKATGKGQDAPAEVARIEAGEDYTNDFARVRAEARDLYGPGRLGQLKWIDARGQMMRPALHAIDPLWIEAFGAYYASQRLIMLARKGLRAGGSSSACPVLTRRAVFGGKCLDSGTVGVIPIMSAARDEADGRFVTIRSYLRAIGFTPAKKRGDDDDDVIDYVVPPGGIAGTFKTKRSTSGGGVIYLRDEHEQEIEFRILPALVRHGIGYTGWAGLADESDLWPNDPEHHVNPAERIFDRISERFTTTYDDKVIGIPDADPGAEFLIFSASYSPDSAHKRAIDDVIETERGIVREDPPRVLTADLAHLVRLGKAGAQRDEGARRALAARLGSDDPRLLAPGDPMSPDLPAWAYNPVLASIDTCYRIAKSVPRMLALYGGRAAEHERLSAGPLADVTPMVDERAFAPWDVVLGCAPPVTGRTWARILVGVAPPGFMRVIADVSGEALEAGLIRGTWHVSVLAVPKGDAARLGAELAAALDGRPHEPVAGVDVHDGPVLRVGPLRTAYERGRLTHAPGLAALESDLRRFTEVTRSPRVEALCAAVARLTACYPWLGAQGDAEPIRGPRSVEAMLIGGDPAREMLRRLGARG